MLTINEQLLLKKNREKLVWLVVVKIIAPFGYMFAAVIICCISPEMWLKAGCILVAYMCGWYLYEGIKNLVRTVGVIHEIDPTSKQNLKTLSNDLEAYLKGHTK